MMISVGVGDTATGEATVAVGGDDTAAGDEDVAVGDGDIVVGDGDTVVGDVDIAVGDEDVAGSPPCPPQAVNKTIKSKNLNLFICPIINNFRPDYLTVCLKLCYDGVTIHTVA